MASRSCLGSLGGPGPLRGRAAGQPANVILRSPDAESGLRLTIPLRPRASAWTALTAPRLCKHRPSRQNERDRAHPVPSISATVPPIAGAANLIY